MSYRGFDPDKLTTLAGQLDTLATNAGGLHRKLATLLTGVQQDLPSGQRASNDNDLQDLVGVGLLPLPFAPALLPGSLTGELGDMQSSMKRRIKQLTGLESFEKSGHPVDAGMLFLDEPPPDGKKVDDALAALKGLENTDFGVNGNRDDLTAVTDKLTGLTGAELDAVISEADPSVLANYNKLLTSTGDSFFNPFDSNGLPEDTRAAALSAMLAKLGPENLPKFTTAFPEVNPTYTDTQAYLNGGNPQNGQNNSGIHWATPTDPLFNGDPSADDINQRQFGDCWYVSSLASVTLKDPAFIKEGIKQNPNGTVSVRIWDKSGNYHWVTVTPDLPTGTDGQPITTYGNGDTWPAYYEKAFALAYGGSQGYGGIEGDDPKNSDPYLTGNTGHDLKTGGFLGIGKHDDMTIADLKKQFDEGKAITVSTPDDDKLMKNTPPEWTNRYCTDHAYYVRGFTSDGKIILGNPWGVSGYPPITVTQDQFNKYFQEPEAFDVP
jgi:hypothetical protein